MDGSITSIDKMVSDFNATLNTKGYTNGVVREVTPNVLVHSHSHAFDVLAKVLQGEITLVAQGESSTYEIGDIFDMPQMCLHEEVSGPEGVTYIYGTRVGQVNSASRV